MANKTLVVGSGYLGKKIAAQRQAVGDQVVVLDVPEIDITSLASVREVIKKQQPNIVINAAALTNTNQLETPEMADPGYKVNVQGPANLLMVCQEVGCYLVHISTGMMFDGSGPEQNGWKETDQPEPTSYYTWTKALADLQLMNFPKVLITRIHLPISRFNDPKNLLAKLTNFDKVLTEQHSATVVEDYLITLDALIEKQAEGVFHAVNPGVISLWEMVELLKKHGKIPVDKEVGKWVKEEFDNMIKEKGGAYQPNPILNTKKLRDLGIKLPDIKEAVEQAIVNFQ